MSLDIYNSDKLLSYKLKFLYTLKTAIASEIRTTIAIDILHGQGKPRLWRICAEFDVPLATFSEAGTYQEKDWNY